MGVRHKVALLVARTLFSWPAFAYAAHVTSGDKKVVPAGAYSGYGDPQAVLADKLEYFLKQRSIDGFVALTLNTPSGGMIVYWASDDVPDAVRHYVAAWGIPVDFVVAPFTPDELDHATRQLIRLFKEQPFHFQWIGPESDWSGIRIGAPDGQIEEVTDFVSDIVLIGEEAGVTIPVNVVEGGTAFIPASG